MDFFLEAEVFVLFCILSIIVPKFQIALFQFGNFSCVKLSPAVPICEILNISKNLDLAGMTIGDIRNRLTDTATMIWDYFSIQVGFDL